MAGAPSKKSRVSPAAAFDLSQLRSFVAVAEELHFGRAAARLGMTQPPLSRQIQILESIVDAPLLERSSRLVRLTAAGESFLADARRILKLADSAAHVARRIASGSAGSLKVGFTASTAYSFLPALVTACSARLPDADLSLKEMVSLESEVHRLRNVSLHIDETPGLTMTEIYNLRGRTALGAAMDFAEQDRATRARAGIVTKVIDPTFTVSI